MESPRLPEQHADTPENWARVEDALLLVGMRRGIEAAVAEFFNRFAPMLNGIARRRGMGRGDRFVAVHEFLDDAAQRLIHLPGSVPRSLPPYLSASFRRRLARDKQVAQRRAEREELMATEIGQATQRAVAESCSEYSIRLTDGIEAGKAGDGLAAGRVQQVREELALALNEGLNEDDRQLLGYVADRMPQREIGELFGIAHGSARMRILRLRERLGRIARAYINTLPSADAIVLNRLLAAPRFRGARDEANAHPPDERQARATTSPVPPYPNPVDERGTQR